MKTIPVTLLLALVVAATSGAPYFPEALYGRPETVHVVERQAPDFRGAPVYLINLSVRETESQQLKDSLVHRNYEEFETLVSKANEEGFTEASLQGEDQVSVEDLDKILNDILSSPGADEWVTFTDFLAINWNADGVEWFKDTRSFMYMLLFARLPEFQPEPAVFESEVDVLHPEVAFEKYIYLAAFRHEELFDSIDDYLDYFKKWTDSTPGFEGPEGDVDVLPPNADGPLELPYHYTKTFVHFLPGGYVNGHTVRISYTGYTKFNFLKESVIKSKIAEIHPNRTLTRILDIGTGNCHSAFAYAEMYPEAEVIGIDLAAPYIRFCNVWKEQKGLTNVHFYQGNAELTTFESESFDLIQYSYVLHEMPTANCRMVLKEAMRLLTPGGVFSGFEVPWSENIVLRQISIASNTWGCEWDDDACVQGPEPYMGEYEQTTRLPSMLALAGFIGTEVTPMSQFDSVFVSYKRE